MNEDQWQRFFNFTMCTLLTRKIGLNDTKSFNEFVVLHTFEIKEFGVVAKDNLKNADLSLNLSTFFNLSDISDLEIKT